jgi:hypothetical protein
MEPTATPALPATNVVGQPSPTALGTCPSCGTSAPSRSFSHIYALGQVRALFPSLGVEKEFSQVVGRSKTSGLSDKEVLHAVCSERENLYLVRQLCWVLSIEGLDTYILQPRDPADYGSLIGTLRATPTPSDMDLVVGVFSNNAPQQTCNGLRLPLIGFDKIYSFDRKSLLEAIPPPKGVKGDEFAAASNELLSRVLQMADNTGANDEDRALNYLVVRYPAIYAKTAEAYAGNKSLTAVDVRPSALSSARKIVDVILSFTDRGTDVCDKYFVRVDVTEEFPFLVTKLSPYYAR